MKNAVRVILILVGLFILATGVISMFAPDRIAEKMLLNPEGAEGLSNIRAFLGAALAAIGISVLIAAVKAEIWHARPAVLFVIGLVVARIIGLVSDGSFPSIGLVVAIPLVVFGLLVAAHILLHKADKVDAGNE